MTATTPTLTLHSKIASVMEAVGYIPKKGRNAVQGYDFVRAADVADAIRTQFAKLKVSIVPETVAVICDRDIETAKGGRQQLLGLNITWRVTDGESGEALTVQSVGYGTDSQDKAAYKAQTGAQKYALIGLALIPQGDDPEEDGKPTASQDTVTTDPLVAQANTVAKDTAGSATEPMRRKVFAEATKAGLTKDQFKALVYLATQKTSSRDLSVADVDKLLGHLAANDEWVENARMVQTVTTEGAGA